MRLMPSMPSTMAPATMKTKKRHTFATTPDMVPRRGPPPAASRSGRRPGWPDAPLEAADDLGAVASGDERHDDDDDDAERPDHEVHDRRCRVRAHPELGEQVGGPAPALVDLVDRRRRPGPGRHQGTGRRQGGRGHGRYSVPESAL